MEGAVQTRPAQSCEPPRARRLDDVRGVPGHRRRTRRQVALRTIQDGVSITFAEYADRVRRLAGGLHALGVRRGDTVGFMLANRPEFHLIDTAAMHLGATPFSIYNTSSPEQIAYLLGDAGNRVFVVEAAFLDRAREATRRRDRSSTSWSSMRRSRARSRWTSSSSPSRPPGFDFDATWRAVKPDDLLTLIYTSGTTGPPKGVQLTHANELAECRGVDAVGRAGAGGRGRLVPAACPHRRPGTQPLRADGLGPHGHLLPRHHAGVRARGRLSTRRSAAGSRGSGRSSRRRSRPESRRADAARRGARGD